MLRSATIAPSCSPSTSRRRCRLYVQFWSTRRACEVGGSRRDAGARQRTSGWPVRGPNGSRDTGSRSGARQRTLGRKWRSTHAMTRSASHARSLTSATRVRFRGLQGLEGQALPGGAGAHLRGLHAGRPAHHLQGEWASPRRSCRMTTMGRRCRRLVAVSVQDDDRLFRTAMLTSDVEPAQRKWRRFGRHGAAASGCGYTIMKLGTTLKFRRWHQRWCG